MAQPGVTRDGEALVFSGPLDRAAATVLWPQVQRLLEGVRRLDLTAVPRIDSAGLALLAEIAAVAGPAGGVALTGKPAGLDELRAAYRLRDTLSFAT